MTATVALLLAYQSLHGMLYAAVGALSAAFMAGFAAGNAASVRASARWGPGRTAVAGAVSFAGVSLAAFAVLVAGAASSPWTGAAAMAFLLAASGAATGLELPALAEWLSTVRTGEGVAAGEVSAADHAGAFLGAVLAAVILVPALGVAETFVVAAAAQAVAGVVLTCLLRRSRGMEAAADPALPAHGGARSP